MPEIFSHVEIPLEHQFVSSAARSPYGRKLVSVTGWNTDRTGLDVKFEWRGFVEGVEQEVVLYEDEVRKRKDLVRRYCFLRNHRHWVTTFPRYKEIAADISVKKVDKLRNEGEVVEIMPVSTDITRHMSLFFVPRQAIDMLEKAVEFEHDTDDCADVDKAVMNVAWRLELAGDEDVNMEDLSVAKEDALEDTFPVAIWAWKVLKWVGAVKVKAWIEEWKELNDEDE